jgi:ribose transport system ATP-binding protein
VTDNISLPDLLSFARYFLVKPAGERKNAERQRQSLNIKTADVETVVGTLSGGNQQKVVLAKWLAGTARVFLFDEPTRGIDVGSKAEIYALMVELLKGGAGIVMVSSELPEVLGMSHRVLVVRDGKIAAELDRSEATPDRVIAVATGVAA